MTPGWLGEVRDHPVCKHSSSCIIGVCGSVCRDIEERGRDLEQVLKQYIHLVKPAFEEFTLPVC